MILPINAHFKVEEKKNSNVGVNSNKMESYYIVESNDGQQRAGVISGKSHTVI